MRYIHVFNHISLDGYFAGPNDEIAWFQDVHDDEWNRYVQEHADLSHSTLTFGHTTYEMMRNWWPTPTAMQMDPKMADVMNNSPKIVFSKTLKDAEEGLNWKNIRVLHEIKPEEIQALKREGDMTILGSGSIVKQFANLGLIDEYSLVIVPIVLGAGKSLFEGVNKMNLRLTEAKKFKNGIVLLRYGTRKKEM